MTRTDCFGGGKFISQGRENKKFSGRNLCENYVCGSSNMCVEEELSNYRDIATPLGDTVWAESRFCDDFNASYDTQAVRRGCDELLTHKAGELVRLF